MRFFHTAGPVRSDLYDCLPPLERLKLPEVLLLIEQRYVLVRTVTDVHVHTQKK